MVAAAFQPSAVILPFRPKLSARTRSEGLRPEPVPVIYDACWYHDEAVEAERQPGAHPPQKAD